MTKHGASIPVVNSSSLSRPGTRKKRNKNGGKRNCEGFERSQSGMLFYVTLCIYSEIINRKLEGLFWRYIPISVQVFRHFQEVFCHSYSTVSVLLVSLGKFRAISFRGLL